MTKDLIVHFSSHINGFNKSGEGLISCLTCKINDYYIIDFSTREDGMQLFFTRCCQCSRATTLGYSKHIDHQNIYKVIGFEILL